MGGFKFLEADSPGYFGRNLVAQCVSAVTAACMVVRREVFEEVAGFDDINLAVAFNDVDLCLRIRELGYFNIFTPFSVLLHHESKSRGQGDSGTPRYQRETEYMLRRWDRYSSQILITTLTSP